MNEQSSWMDHRGAYRPHPGGLIFLVIPLGIGFMLGMRKGMMHEKIGPGKRCEYGVPPFFAELHRRAHVAAEQPGVTDA